MDPRLLELDRSHLLDTLAPFGTERTLPGAAYTSPTVAAWEAERLWEDGWVCLGRAESFEAGTATERRVGTESLIVAATAHGIEVFHNVCRHRGHEILHRSERRTASSLVCPYHGWLYRMDGTLRAAPKTSHRSDLDGITLGAVRSAVWHGWLMVSLSAETVPVSQHLGPMLDDLIKPYDPGSLVVADSRRYEVAANWKLVHENYHECYHCASIHPQLVEVSNPDSGDNLTPDGAWIGGWLQFRPGVETMSMDGRSAGAVITGLNDAHHGRALYVGLLPNLLLSLHPDYVLTHRLEMLGPGQTLIECEWLFPRPVVESPDFDPTYAVEFWDITNRQDWDACASLQRGASSRAYERGVLGSGEDAVYQFIAVIAAAYLDGRIAAAPNPRRGSIRDRT